MMGHRIREIGIYKLQLENKDPSQKSANWCIIIIGVLYNPPVYNSCGGLYRTLSSSDHLTSGSGDYNKFKFGRWFLLKIVTIDSTLYYRLLHTSEQVRKPTRLQLANAVQRSTSLLVHIILYRGPAHYQFILYCIEVYFINTEYTVPCIDIYFPVTL